LTPKSDSEHHTARHPELLSSPFGYVAVSRSSHEVTVFINGVTGLAQQLGTEVTKTAALEINQSAPMGGGLGNGLI
jgi:hypothetical protein